MGVRAGTAWASEPVEEIWCAGVLWWVQRPAKIAVWVAAGQSSDYRGTRQQGNPWNRGALLVGIVLGGWLGTEWFLGFIGEDMKMTGRVVF
jgi:hypothetical protein